MSRSIRHTPIIPFTTAKSEKKDKQLSSRAVRRINTRMLKAAQDLTAMYARTAREVYGCGSWKFDKDGKQWMGLRADKKWLRK